MKKTEKILFLGFSALMFILIGCSNKDNLQENKKSSAVEQTANLTAGFCCKVSKRSLVFQDDSYLSRDS
ncbi:hypothetical protein [Enterococcus faecalis]|uniref:hypothetical protein n=1 Tax=Enterococcus faecalis TaxID=1351 RepID=UPI0010119123|nr:hypothetical protein [Enterococcus faecalis]RXU85806.1 hypothetical protein CYQ49_13830 [Enterococcus faecalis]